MKSLLVLLLCGLALVRGHYHSPLEDIPVHDIRVNLMDNVRIKASPSVLNNTGDWVTVIWHGMERPNRGDFIGVYSPPDAAVNETAPVKYQSMSLSRTHLTTGSGALRFRLINLRAPYIFRIFQGGINRPVMVGESNVVEFREWREVTQVHLALTGVKGEMRASWVTSHDENSQPVVQWRESVEQEYEEVSAKSTTYTRGQLCDEPAITVGYHDPGSIHTGIMTGLQPGHAYNYRVGDKGTVVFSEHFTFTVGPPGADEDPNVEVTVAVFGDMGTAEPDGTLDSGHNEEVPSLNTTRLLLRALHNPHKPLQLVVHIGDISYARGYDTQWDEFFTQIEPIAARVPWMVGSGNHERDSPATSEERPELSLYTGTDSGGECGVPYQTRLPMPGPAEDPKADQAWYSFDFGPIHFFMACSESDYRVGSPQYEYLVQDLKAVDRAKTPWVVFCAHRPMYIDSSYDPDPENEFSDSDQAPARLMRSHLEPLLLEHKVDLGLYGHHHSYQRTCQAYNEQCLAPSNDTEYHAPVHLVIGMGGQTLTPNLLDEQPSVFEFINVRDYGLPIMHANNTHLSITFYGDKDGRSIDRFHLSRSA